jgi:hypothetical protein
MLMAMPDVAKEKEQLGRYDVNDMVLIPRDRLPGRSVR